jgi:hypothetical protein
MNDHPAYQQAVLDARQRYAKGQIDAVNPFFAIRRPAEYA